MEISIKHLEAYDTVFNEKNLTLQSLKGIIEAIKQTFGDITVCFFFDKDGSFERYKTERYFNGVFQVDPTTHGINLCPSLNSSEALIWLHDLEDMINRIPTNVSIRQDQNTPITITEDSIIQVGASQIEDPTGNVVEIFIIEGECFILTSTYGINWEDTAGSTSFSQRVLTWFFSEYCVGLDYTDIYRVLF